MRGRSRESRTGRGQEMDTPGRAGSRWPLSVRVSLCPQKGRAWRHGFQSCSSEGFAWPGSRDGPGLTWGSSQAGSLLRAEAGPPTAWGFRPFHQVGGR